MTLEVIVTLLVIALVLLVLFAVLGFVAHVLWWGLIIAVGIAIYHAASGSNRSRV